MRLCVAFTLLLTGVSAAAAFEVGDMVVAIHDVEVKVDYRIVDKVTAGATLKIEALDGDRVQVNDGSPGWINTSDVVPQAKAIGHFDDTISKNPKDATAYRARGRVWQDRKEHDRAIADYDEALRLDPKNAWAYALRGEAWNSKQQTKQALADFDEALQLDPDLAWAYSARGDVFAKQGDYDNAIADFSEALQIDPHQAQVFESRGNAWFKKGEYYRAIYDLNEVLQRNPDDASAQRSSWDCLVHERRLRQGGRRLQSRHPARTEIGERLPAARHGSAFAGGLRARGGRLGRSLADRSEKRRSSQPARRRLATPGPNGPGLAGFGRGPAARPQAIDGL